MNPFLKLIFFMIICTFTYANVPSKKIQNENSILAIHSDVITLNPQCLEFAEGKIFLHTQTLGSIHLNEVIFDGKSYFCKSDELLWGVMVCQDCNYTTTERIDTCPNCGSSKIVVIDNWPN